MLLPFILKLITCAYLVQANAPLLYGIVGMTIEEMTALPEDFKIEPGGKS
jgi:hypothetical protein